MDRQLHPEERRKFSLAYEVWGQLSSALERQQEWFL